MKFTKVKILKSCPELAYKEGDEGQVLTSKVERLQRHGYVQKIKEKRVIRKRTTKVKK